MIPPGVGDGALTGWRVLVPRPIDQAGGLVAALADHGAEAVAAALISIEPPVDLGALDEQLLELGRGTFAWVAFTSANAVAAVVDRASSLGLPAPVRARVAAVGPATAAALVAAGVQVDLLPPGGSAAALAETWPPAASGESVLLPRSDLAPPLLPEALTAKGYRVITVDAYRTVPRPPATALAAELSAGGFDAVLFTSASTVGALTGVPLPSSTVLGAIGAPTTRALVSANRPVAFTAAEPTTRALVDGLLGFVLSHPEYQKADVRQ